MKFKIKAYNLQELGQRENQEDSLYPALGKQTDQDRLFILCDGMGGHEKGEVASSTVCDVISKTVLSIWNPNEPLTDEMFKTALDKAFDALDAKDNGEERKMGTTMTFLCLHANGVTVAHIGDSRVYQLRPKSKKGPAQIVFRTQDHSLVNDLVKIGEITEEEAKHHPQKNVITRAMQPSQERRVKADIAHLTDVKPGDYFYMCSDGMLEQASDENILNIITKPDATNEQKIEILHGATDENRDNHTANIIYIENVIGVPVTQNVSQTTSEPHGVWIAPEYSNKKKRSWTLWLIVIVAIVIAVVVSMLTFGGKILYPTDGSMIDTIHIDTISSRQDTLRKDSVKKNIASPIPNKIRIEEKVDTGSRKSVKPVKGTDLQQRDSSKKSAPQAPKDEKTQEAKRKFLPKEAPTPNTSELLNTNKK